MLKESAVETLNHVFTFSAYGSDIFYFLLENEITYNLMNFSASPPPVAAVGPISKISCEIACKTGDRISIR